MVDVTTLDVYRSTGNGKKYLNVTSAKEDKLLGKWLIIDEVYVAPASKFDKEGKMLEEKEDKLHIEFREIEHIFTLNKTNFDTLVKDFGTESDEWVGESVKLRLHTYPQGAKGVVIPGREDLADEGETPPTRAVAEDKDTIKKAVKESSAVKMVVSELTDMGEQVTMKTVMRELRTAKEQSDITKAQYTEALEALS